MEGEEAKVEYFERQSLQLCALHTVNNLLQRKEYSKKDFTNIAYTLSPNSVINPHKSIFGTGNFDVNIIMYALQQQNLETKWYDKRKGVEEINFDECYGIIVNQWQPPFLWVFRAISRHWFPIKKINGIYYNLDSKLEKPQAFASEDELRTFLKTVVCDPVGSRENESQILIVKSPSS